MNKTPLKGSRDVEYLTFLREQSRRNSAVLYTCKVCKYTFSGELLRPDEMEDELYRCPDCGKFAVRPATADEIEWHQKHLTEKDNEDE